MAGLLDRVYPRMPVPVQDLMVSVRGYQLRRERFGGSFRHYCAEFEATQWLPEAEHRQRQLEELRRLVAHAYENVPFYRERMKQAQVSPGDIDSLDALRLMPVVDRQDIKAYTKDFIDRRLDPSRLLCIHTSGTTGACLDLYYTPEERRKAYALSQRSLAWAGYQDGMRRATFNVRPIVPIARDRPPFSRVDWPSRTRLFSPFHLSPKNMPHYVREIREWGTQFIQAYPSHLWPVADYMVQEGIQGLKLAGIATSSETLVPKLRSTLEQAFSCRVMDFYGMAEMAAFFSQCPEQTYHDFAEYAYVEFLDDADQPVKPGTPGRIVATSFITWSMPLIRYNTRDLAVPSEDPEPCPCGRGLPKIRGLVGRTDDLVVTPDGRRLGRFTWLFKDTPEIKQGQVIQKALDRILIRVLPAGEFPPELSEKLRAKCVKSLGDQVSVEVEVVSELARTASGKFRAVVSELPKNDLNWNAYGEITWDEEAVVGGGEGPSAPGNR